MAIDLRQELRAELRARRHALDARARMAAGQAIADLLRPSLSGRIAGYWAMDAEVPLLALLSGRCDFVYCLPVLQPGKRLCFAPWRAGDPLLQNRFGIPEPDLQPSALLAPEELDHVLLPLLGFDASGQRLGSGGGYYDRSFAFRRDRGAPPHLIGIGFATQEVAGLSRRDWDVDVDAIATERELILASTVANAG